MIDNIRLQPLVSLNNRLVLGYEVLYNRKHKNEFPSALDIINCICNYELDINNFQLYINMTIKDVISLKFANNFMKSLDRFKINPNNIVLEISEQTHPNLIISATKVIKLLHQNNIKIALDDFGVRYSTISYLCDFPIDIVKINQTFIQKAPRNTHFYSVLKSITNLSHEFNCKVVAEGIENNEQLDYVLNAGIDIGQGFLFSPSRITKITSPFATLLEFISGIITTPAKAVYCNY